MDAQQTPERRHEEIGKIKQETKDTHSVETLVKALGRALINQEEYMENLGTDAYVNMLREKNNALVNLVKGNHDLALRTIKYLELLIARRVEDPEVFDNISRVVTEVAKAGGVTQEEIEAVVDEAEAQSKSKEPVEVKKPASNREAEEAKKPNNAPSSMSDEDAEDDYEAYIAEHGDEEEEAEEEKPNNAPPGTVTGEELFSKDEWLEITGDNTPALQKKLEEQPVQNPVDTAELAKKFNLDQIAGTFFTNTELSSSVGKGGKEGSPVAGDGAASVQSEGYVEEGRGRAFVGKIEELGACVALSFGRAVEELIEPGDGQLMAGLRAFAQANSEQAVGACFALRKKGGSASVAAYALAKELFGKAPGRRMTVFAWSALSAAKALRGELGQGANGVYASCLKRIVEELSQLEISGSDEFAERLRAQAGLA